jgi:phage I-like protein
MSNHPPNGTQTDEQLLALAGAQVDAKPIPTRVLLAPWGQVESTNGTFIVDEESARMVIEAFTSHQTDLPIDYEHQTLGGQYSSPTGKAPAAGWIKAIEAEPGVGLFASVAWTEAAVEHLAAGQYRYLSPVAVVRKSDRKLVALHSAALTNKPAIAGMQPIVNQSAADDATSRDEALVALRAQLALDEGCGEDDVFVAASRRIADLEADRQRRDAEGCVDAAVRAGKLTEVQRPWALQLAQRDRDLFDQWAHTAPTVVSLGRTAAPATAGQAHGARHRLEAMARAEYHAHPELAALTSEEAYVADSIRGHAGN